MGRLPRPTGDDLIYHAINRGNNRADVLGPDGERDMFLGDIARTQARYPFALFGYCLMSNHFHLLLKPAPGQSISRILQSLTVAHTWRHHRRQGTSGHVWQGRFRSPVIQDGDHLLVVLRYIEANPVRAAMVADPCESTWSSHRCHGAGHADPILDSFPEWEQLGRTEPERRARWRRKVRGEQPAKGVGWRAVVGAQWPALRCRGLGRGHFPPIASASSVSRAVVVVRRAKRRSDTGIPHDTGIPQRAMDRTVGRIDEFSPGVATTDSQPHRHLRSISTLSLVCHCNLMEPEHKEPDRQLRRGGSARTTTAPGAGERSDDVPD